MSNNLDFKKLERKAYTAYHQDGIVDVIIGLCILGFGIRMATDSPAFLILSWMPILFYMPLKNRLTAPRFGYVRFESKRSTSLKMSLAILVGLVFLVFILGLLVFGGNQAFPSSLQSWLKRYHMLILGGFAALAFTATGLMAGIHRFFGYAVLLFVIIMVGIWLGIPAPIYVLCLGTLILIIGLYLMYHFMQKYPLNNEG